MHLRELLEKYPSIQIFTIPRYEHNPCTGPIRVKDGHYGDQVDFNGGILDISRIYKLDIPVLAKETEKEVFRHGKLLALAGFMLGVIVTIPVMVAVMRVFG